MLNKFEAVNGFIAALDQSGGSTPRTIEQYGLLKWSNEDEMFDIVHAMRTRVMTSPTFSGDKVLGVILFEDTINREVAGLPTAQYLWEEKGIVPFAKIDKGLEEFKDGCQKLRPITDLDETLIDLKSKGIFGTKMRSVIYNAHEKGINELVKQQFDIAKVIMSKGLVPIIEPEVSIDAEFKELAEMVLRANLEHFLDKLDDDERVILKLTLPEIDNYYADLITHPNVLKVVALSGGYSQEVANKKLAANKNVSASFSRALLRDLRAEQNEHEFDAVLSSAIDSIYQASIT
jgi:fructose-bisphosphate aldolase, class I